MDANGGRVQWAERYVDGRDEARSSRTLSVFNAKDGRGGSWFPSALGLWLDRIGQLPSNRMLDAYDNEDSMRTIYDAILKFAIERTDWISRFWDSAAEAASGLPSKAALSARPVTVRRSS